MKWMKKEVAMKRNQLRILCTLSLAFIALLCLSLSAYADMGPKPDLTVTVVNAPEGLCYVDLLYEGGGDDLHSDFDTSGCDQKLIASLHTLEGDGWTLALTTGISSGPPIFGDLTPNSDGAYHYSYHGLPRTFRLAVATEEGIQATQESYTRTRFHTNLVYDWITNTVSEVTPSLVYYTAQFLATFVPTLIIEGIILWLFKFRQKRTWLIFLLVNFGTQLALHLYCDLLGGVPFADSYDSVGYYVLSLLGPEFLIFIAEAISYGALIKEEASGRRVGYAACANAASFVLGYFPVHWLLPLLNWL